MRLIRIRAIAKKELVQIARDPLSLAMAFLMPVMLLFIFGYAITLDVNNLRTVVYDMDRSSLSREFVAGLSESGYFSIIEHVQGYKDVERYLDSGKAQIALAIPERFFEDIKKGRSVTLQAITDGSDSNTSVIALGYLTAIAESFSQKAGQRRGAPLVEPRARIWYNPELKSRNFIIPGLIAIIMAVIAALLTSLTIAREWERGTMEQLISTPIKTPELILGKLLPYLFIGLADVVTSVLLAVFVFGVPLKGSVVLLIVLSGVFLFGGLNLGILVSIATRSQLVASQVSMVVTFLPAFLLSGFMFAISNMPLPLQALTHIVPARYFVAILKGIFLKGSPLDLLYFEASLLVVFALSVFLIAVMKFTKKVV